jgi:DDE superfamily endonuclease
MVADAGFSALELIAAVRRHVCLITGLRLDASLFEPAPKRRKGQIGRPALKGKRRPKLRAFSDPLDSRYMTDFRESARLASLPRK